MMFKTLHLSKLRSRKTTVPPVVACLDQRARCAHASAVHRLAQFCIGLAILITTSIAFADSPDHDEPYAVSVVPEGPTAASTELPNAKGTLTLTLAAGKYNIYLQQGSEIRRCIIELDESQELELQPSGCKILNYRMRRRRGWALELGIGPVRSVVDESSIAFIKAGYEGLDPTTHDRLAGALVIPLRRIQAVVEFSNLEGRSVSLVAPGTGSRQTTTWKSLALALKVRSPLVYARGRLPWLGPFTGGQFLEAGLGLAAARTTVTSTLPAPERDIHYGPVFQLAFVETVTFKNGIGFFVKAEFTYAPVIDFGNDDRHDIGGVGITGGPRFEW